MPEVTARFGGKQGRTLTLVTNEDLIVVRSREPLSVSRDAHLSARALSVLGDYEPHLQFSAACVEVFRARRDGSATQRDKALAVLKQEPSLRFAGRVLTSPVLAAARPEYKDPVIYTQNYFVKFARTVPLSKVRKALAARDLKLKREVEYLENAYFVAAPENSPLEAVFQAAESLLGETEVQYCHPELVRERSFRATFPAPQWHLGKTKVGGTTIDQHASVAAAWERARGRGITIAIIDTGIDLDHEEFAGARKVVSPRDATGQDADPRPAASHREDHGTACAGVACASGKKGASGVAPEARLMPIRLMSALGSQNEADAFAWAADHGADVISCSWGPIDGDWWDPSDPRHGQFVPLPDNTRLAIDYATTRGRRGKGSVVLFAAGNGNESIDMDGYASYPGVIAVAACNDRGTRSGYSDFGPAVWCCFPSDEVHDPPAHVPRTPGIWTTDRTGKSGYNPGGSTGAGDAAGHYTNGFGGTSSATPGVAGVVALVLEVDPQLTVAEVRDVLKGSSDAIDKANGAYSAATGHSDLYGYGRVNAAKAVTRAEKSKAARAGRKKAKPKRR